MQLNKNEIIKALDEFYEIYQRRPVKDNTGGMKSAHLFATWYMMRQLDPDFIIESGVFKGQGTWILEQACQHAAIWSIDLNLDQRVYVSDKVIYSPRDFVEDPYMGNYGKSVIFFDDHQNCIPRMKRCKELEFKQMIFEDNYMIGQGDCISPEKVKSGGSYIIDKAGSRRWQDSNVNDTEWFTENVKEYQIFPPIFADPISRWGTLWKEEYINSPEPLLSESEKYKYPMFWEERKDYTQICYIELC